MPLLRRGPRIPADDTVVRFLVIPPERTELVRFKLAPFATARQGARRAELAYPQVGPPAPAGRPRRGGPRQLGPLLGLDPEIEREAEQLALFG